MQNTVFWELCLIIGLTAVPVQSSLTSNVERSPPPSPQSPPLPSAPPVWCTKSVFGATAAAGTPCTFPFSYDGELFYDCADAPRWGGDGWCYTNDYDADYHQPLWGGCILCSQPPSPPSPPPPLPGSGAHVMLDRVQELPLFILDHVRVTVVDPLQPHDAPVQGARIYLKTGMPRQYQSCDSCQCVPTSTSTTRPAQLSVSGQLSHVLYTDGPRGLSTARLPYLDAGNTCGPHAMSPPVTQA